MVGHGGVVDFFRLLREIWQQMKWNILKILWPNDCRLISMHYFLKITCSRRPPRHSINSCNCSEVLCDLKKLYFQLTAQNIWFNSSVLILLASCQQTCMTYIIVVCTVKNSWWWTQQTCMTYTIVVRTVKNSWWWTEEMSETCRVLFQK